MSNLLVSVFIHNKILLSNVLSLIFTSANYLLSAPCLIHAVMFSEQAISRLIHSDATAL